MRRDWQTEGLIYARIYKHYIFIKLLTNAKSDLYCVMFSIIYINIFCASGENNHLSPRHQSIVEWIYRIYELGKLLWKQIRLRLFSKQWCLNYRLQLYFSTKLHRQQVMAISHSKNDFNSILNCDNNNLSYCCIIV